MAEASMSASTSRPVSCHADFYSKSAVASAVVLPETEDQSQPPTPSLKRKHSSVSDSGSKRLRLSQDGSSNRRGSTAMSPPHSAREDRLSERRKSGHGQEDRKRGQRLFGALLGTLSQSSSSTANKRRADIEKKQQAKLRLQTEEETEKKKAKLEELMAVRRREQKNYNMQSVRLERGLLAVVNADIVPDADTALESTVSGALPSNKGRTMSCKSY